MPRGRELSDREYIEKYHNPGAGLSAQQFDQIPVERFDAQYTNPHDHDGWSGTYRSTYSLAAQNDKGTTGAVVDINPGRTRYQYPSHRARYEDVHPENEFPANKDGQRELFHAYHEPAQVDMLFATANRPEGAPRRELVNRLLETAVGDHYRRTGQQVQPSTDLSPGSAALVQDHKDAGVLHENTPAAVRNDVSLDDAENSVEDHLNFKNTYNGDGWHEVPNISRQFAPLAVGQAPKPTSIASKKRAKQEKLF